MSFVQTLFAALMVVMASCIFAMLSNYHMLVGSLTIVAAVVVGVVTPIACSEMFAFRLNVLTLTVRNHPVLSLGILTLSQIMWVLTVVSGFSELVFHGPTVMVVRDFAGAAILLPCALYVVYHKKSAPREEIVS